MSTTESITEPVRELRLVSSIIDHDGGIPASTAAGLAGANAVVIQPAGREYDGEGVWTLLADVHLGNIEGHVAASLLRDIANQLDEMDGEAVSDD